MRPFYYVSIVFLLVMFVLAFMVWQTDVSIWWLLPPFIVYIHLLVLGAIYIRWNFYLKSFHKGTNSKWIALTFDDGPNGETAAILDILGVHKVPAAFFSIGKNAVANPKLVKRWHEEGHLIGNHSFHHGFHFDWQSAERMCEELQQTNEAIYAIVGVRPKLFRPPYGVTNPNLARAIKQTRMHSIGWSVRSFDTTAKSAPQLLARILDNLQGGDIILLHDSMPVTKEILTELIQKAQQKGFTFVRVDKMLGLDAYA